MAANGHRPCRFAYLWLSRVAWDFPRRVSCESNHRRFRNHLARNRGGQYLGACFRSLSRIRIREWAEMLRVRARYGEIRDSRGRCQHHGERHDRRHLTLAGKFRKVGGLQGNLGHLVARRRRRRRSCGAAADSMERQRQSPLELEPAERVRAFAHIGDGGGSSSFSARLFSQA